MKKGIEIYVQDWNRDRRRVGNYKFPDKNDLSITGEQTFYLFAAILIGMMLLIGPFVC
jgi:hypothetical protein